MVRKLALFLLIPFSAALGQTPAAKPAAKPEFPFFALQMQEEEHGGYVIEPLLMSDGATYKVPPLQSTNAREQKQAEAFQARAFRPGTAYNLFAGGKRVGEVKVLKDISDELGTYAAVDVNVAEKQPKLQGIATNAEWLKDTAHPGRALTVAESATLRALAEKYLRARAVSPAVLGKLELTGSTAADLDGDGKLEFVATFRGQEVRKDVETNHSLLLVSQDGTDVAFANYLKTGETEVETEILFDHMDLDADGVDELIVNTHYYEDTGFDVYSRKAGKWKKVYSVVTAGP